MPQPCPVRIGGSERLNSDTIHLTNHVVLINPNPYMLNLHTARVTRLTIRVCELASHKRVDRPYTNIIKFKVQTLT